MIIDIDKSKSVISSVKTLTESWFNIDQVYEKIKSDSSIKQGSFWHYPDYLIFIVSNKIDCSSEKFQKIFIDRCLMNDCNIMGYHCTRHNDKSVFLKNGVLPLSKKIINFSENQNSKQAEEIIKFRSESGPGPYFLLSYSSAKEPNNAFCQKGAEILLGCKGNLFSNELSKSKPLILHCVIPFSILSNHKYYIFCILMAYFNFIDPEGEDENLFVDYSIDLKNQPLDPKYILEIEER